MSGVSIPVCSHPWDNVRLRFAVVVLLLADVAALLFSVLISLLLRFDGTPWDQLYRQRLQDHLWSLPLAIAVYVGIYSAFRLYRCVWRFAGLEMLGAVIYSNSLGILALIVLQAVIDGSIFPRSVLVMLWGASIVLIGGVRVTLRMLSTAERGRRHSADSGRRKRRRKNVVILGAGSSGVAILRAIREDRSLCCNVVGFLDDDPQKNGIYISNVKVLGPIDNLEQILEDAAVDEVIVALPETNGDKIRECVMLCKQRATSVKVAPQIRDVLAGTCRLNLVDFSVEDLLRRPARNGNMKDISRYLKGKRVLVTGAGGSIGSELCRQIAEAEPRALILLGHGENSIFHIYQELRNAYPHIAERIEYVIASVSHQTRVNHIFERFRPQVVFHAAAHKHVPIMETNEQEAVYNNVLGTRNVAEACGRWGVERMVLISTDKAASPCCIMGATKWLCEESVRAVAAFWPRVSYITVRFGNVLGSRGSVVPVFRDQIERGGPVTITHPEMTRYFMTIPEAVRLVVQASGVGASGDLYLLDMGEPVKILDLAKDMIRLSGLEPGVDITFAFTGVRPGEKLHEELTSPNEQIERTSLDGLSLVRRPNYFTPDEMLDALSQLERASCNNSAAAVRAILNHLIPCEHKVFAGDTETEMEDLISRGTQVCTTRGAQAA